jgi:hypothetical protein
VGMRILSYCTALLFLACGCMPPGKSGPVASFDHGIIDGKVISEDVYETNDDVGPRVFRDIVLDVGDAGGTAAFTVSLPVEVPSDGLQCLIIMAGLGTGKLGLEAVPDHGDKALISYEYPPDFKLMREIRGALHVPSVRRGAYDTPQQVVTIAQWVRKQEWSDGKPTAIIGISAGAIMTPATYHLANVQGQELGPGVIAYGGAGLCNIFYNIVPGYWFFRGPLAMAATMIFNKVEPGYHVQRMHGEFLIVNGNGDLKIPSSAAEKLQDLAPEPKDIVNTDTTHIQTHKKDVVIDLFNLTNEWLDQ